MKKNSSSTTKVLLLCYIPILAYLAYIIFIKAYDDNWDLSSLFEAFVCVVLIITNTIIIVIVNLTGAISESKHIENNQLSEAKKSKNKIIIYSTLLFVIIAMIVYSPVKNFLGRTTNIPVEPTYEEVMELINDNPWSYTNDFNRTDNYHLKVSNKDEFGKDEALNSCYFYYTVVIIETGQEAQVKIRKCVSQNNITKAKSDIQLSLFNIDVLNDKE